MGLLLNETRTDMAAPLIDKVALGRLCVIRVIASPDLQCVPLSLNGETVFVRSTHSGEEVPINIASIEEIKLL